MRARWVGRSHPTVAWGHLSAVGGGLVFLSLRPLLPPSPSSLLGRVQRSNLPACWTPPPPGERSGLSSLPSTPTPPHPLPTHRLEWPDPPRSRRPRSWPRTQAWHSPSEASSCPAPELTGGAAKPRPLRSHPSSLYRIQHKGWCPPSRPASLPPSSLCRGLVETGPSCCPGNHLSQGAAAWGYCVARGPPRGTDPASSPTSSTTQQS